MSFGKNISNTTKNWYTTLSLLCKIKGYTPLPIRKQMAESLILFYYIILLLFDILKYMKQLQKVQNAAADFVLNKYANMKDVINVKWLPIEEQIEYSLAIMGFKAIYDENVTNLLKLMQKVASTYNLRRNKGTVIDAKRQSKTREETKVGISLTNYPQTFNQQNKFKN